MRQGLSAGKKPALCLVFLPLTPALIKLFRHTFFNLPWFTALNIPEFKNVYIRDHRLKQEAELRPEFLIDRAVKGR